MEDVRIECALASPTHADRIVELIRQGFSEQFLSMTPMGCHGAAEYCRHLIQAQDQFGDSTYAVAAIDDEVAGCIELRTTTDSIFINYVCVAPEARSHGIASRLLRYAADVVRTPAHRWLRLDVLEDNAVARRWYEGLGFQTESTTDWHTMPLPKGNNAAGYVSGLPQAEVLQRAFGFSQINVLASSGRYSVGLLGDEWLRVTDSAVLADSDATGVLASRYPDRTALVLAPTGDLPEELVSGARLRARTLRMSLDLSRYDARIQEEG